MKRYIIFTALFLTIILNIYLVLYWNPQEKVYIQDKSSEEVVTYFKSIYKVSKEKAFEQLSYEDKADLERIMKKLSTFDMGRIKEYYGDSDEEKGVINIFELLKKRLSTEDYRRIEEISSSFLDIKRVKEKIKK